MRRRYRWRGWTVALLLDLAACAAAPAEVAPAIEPPRVPPPVALSGAPEPTASGSASAAPAAPAATASQPVRPPSTKGMILLPGGTFLSKTLEKTVTVAPLWLDVTEVRSSKRSSPPAAPGTSTLSSGCSIPTSSCDRTFQEWASSVGPRVWLAWRKPTRGGPRSVLPVLVNGAAGAVIVEDERAALVMAFTVSNGKIVAIDLITDPERLRHVDLAALAG